MAETPSECIDAYLSSAAIALRSKHVGHMRVSFSPSRERVPRPSAGRNAAPGPYGKNPAGGSKRPGSVRPATPTVRGCRLHCPLDGAPFGDPVGSAPLKRDAEVTGQVDLEEAGQP